MWGELTGELEETKRFNTKDPIHRMFQSKVVFLSYKTPFRRKSDTCLNKAVSINKQVKHTRLCNDRYNTGGGTLCADMYFMGDACKPSYYMACEYRGDKFKDCVARTYIEEDHMLSYHITEEYIPKQLEILESWKMHLNQIKSR
jgi:hypothetical protein